MQANRCKLIFAFLLFSPPKALPGDTVCLEPTPYVRTEDSPFDLSGLGSTMFLDDFEDGTLDGPMISPDTRVRGPGPLTDSVDADDGIVDGQGNGGHSLETTRYIVHPTFPWTYRTFFDIIFTDIDHRPNAFGIVWADGFIGSTLRLTAFSHSGATIAECTYGSLMDGLNTGETAEDRFIGIVADQRIARISGFSESVGFQPESERVELDHIQFGQQKIPEPSSFMIAMTLMYLCTKHLERRRGL
jgi:hypothetical protein